MIYKRLKAFLIRLGIAAGTALFTDCIAIPAFAADTIIFSYPPFGEFTLSRQSLERFAQKGEITDDLVFYARFMNASQRNQVRELLQSRFKVSHVMLSQFTYSPLGEATIKRLGELLQTETRDNGYQALRAALILSAADPEGLTLLNALKQFPSRQVRINLKQGLQTINELSELVKRREATIAAIEQSVATEMAGATQTFSPSLDLRSTGRWQWQKRTLELRDSTRARVFFTDLYLPTTPIAASALPLVVISHGLASDRDTFAYLGEHLASYGFAVAVLEHPGSSREKFQRYLAGLEGPPKATEFLDRPLDVTFLLDELQRRSQTDTTLRDRINTQQVSIIGQSLGGYTALALAGAKINAQTLAQQCNPNRSLNISMLLQCRANDLPEPKPSLTDPRIKAVIAINPLASSVLGQAGLSQIQVPVMLIGGSEDFVTPAGPEQIRPFTWLTTSNKYLVLMRQATHFSALRSSPNRGVLPIPAGMIGKQPEVIQAYIRVLSTAFLQTYTANQSEYRSYLSSAYIQSISQPSAKVTLVRSLNPSLLK